MRAPEFNWGETGKMAEFGLSDEKSPSIDGRPIRILLADHLELVRESLRYAVYRATDDLSLVECDNFDAAVKICRESENINLAILALRLPGLGGLDGIRQFRNCVSNVPVSAISAFYQYTDILRVFELGAIGFLSKEMNSAAIISAIRCMLSGHRFIPDEVLEAIDSKGKKSISSGDVPLCDVLTEREIEVLDLLVAGHSNKSIARILSVEEITIKVHISKILRKMHAENRTQAVAIAFQSHCSNCPYFSQ